MLLLCYVTKCTVAQIDINAVSHCFIIFAQNVVCLHIKEQIQYGRCCIQLKNKVYYLCYLSVQ